VSLIEKEGVENDDLDLGQGPASFLEIGVGVLEEGVTLIEKEGGPSVENNDLGQGFVVGKEGSLVVEVGVVGCLIEKEGGSKIENKVGIVEEALILIENEGGSRVANGDLGQGPESFVVEVGESMGGRQLNVVVDPVDAGAVDSGVDDWKGLDGWRGLDDWMVQKKVSE